MPRPLVSPREIVRLKTSVTAREIIMFAIPGETIIKEIVRV